MLTEEFDLVSVLGCGSYGEVYKAVHRQHGRICAVKVLPSETTPESYERIKKEISIMVECNNRNIVKCFGSESNEHGICLFLEYCAGGSVKDVLRASPGTRLTEEHIASILQPTLLGLEYLHQRKTIHRDIKAGNILINEFGDIKLSDFGVSAELMHTLADKDTLIGSPFWMSPQVLSKNKYNCKTDIWSLGITAIELAEGEPPYSHIHPIRAMFAIQNNPPKGLSHPEKWSKQFNEFVKKCLQYEPTQRPSARQLLTDPFILSKAKGQYILQMLVNNCSDNLEKNRKEMKSSISGAASGTSVLNDNGTMIEHQGRVDKYEPFWEGQKAPIPYPQCEQPSDGTMVVKEASPEKKQADFVVYYRQKHAQQQRNQQKLHQLSGRKQVGPVELQRHKEQRNPKQPDALCKSTESACEAQILLNQLVQQMNRQIEKIKKRYQPQLNHLSQLVQQHAQSKMEEEKVTRKLKSTSNDTASSVNRFQPSQQRKTEPDAQDGRKPANPCADSFGVPAVAYQPQVSKPKKTKLLETQTFEQALHQLKESKKNVEQDGSYFTSFLKKMKKQPGQKQNTQANHEELGRTQKIEPARPDRQQFPLQVKLSRK